MFDYVKPLGYDIVDLGNNQWLLDVKGVAKYHGTLKELIKFCVKKYDFEIDELDYVINKMIELGHNAASFGVYRTFLHSFNREVNYVKKAS